MSTMRILTLLAALLLAAAPANADISDGVIKIGIMNDKSIGSVTNLMYNATINRDGIGGSWCERDLAFDASLMKAGTNTLELTIPPGGLTSGIMYDYLRLELDEQASSK